MDPVFTLDGSFFIDPAMTHPTVIGNSGAGSLSLTDGTLSINLDDARNTTSSFDIGQGVGGEGVVGVAGVDTTLEILRETGSTLPAGIALGTSGARGTLDIRNGGAVIIDNPTGQADLDVETGSVVVDAGSISISGTEATFTVGGAGSAVLTNGSNVTLDGTVSSTLTVEDGGTLEIGRLSSIVLGDADGPTGLLETLDGSELRLSRQGRQIAGDVVIGDGTLITVNGARGLDSGLLHTGSSFDFADTVTVNITALNVHENEFFHSILIVHTSDPDADFGLDADFLENRLTTDASLRDVEHGLIEHTALSGPKALIFAILPVEEEAGQRITTFGALADAVLEHDTGTGLTNMQSQNVEGYFQNIEGIRVPQLDGSVDITGSGVFFVDAGDGDGTINLDIGRKVVDGGDGTDTVIYSGNRRDYTITRDTESITVTQGGLTDTLTNVERIGFDDETLTLSSLSDHIVDTASDSIDPNDGLTSLREALLLSNSEEGQSLIEFDAALSGATITLALGQLEITDDVIIEGDIGLDGTNDITISGDDASRVFYVSGGTSVLGGLTIADGRAETNEAFVTGGPGTPEFGEGGGVWTGFGTTLTIERSTIRDNRAVDDFGFVGYGGGISSRGTLALRDSTVSDNTADLGAGGIVNFGAASLINTTVANNTGGEAYGFGWGGGGIFNYTQSPLILINSTVTGNTSPVAGGGLQQLVGVLPPALPLLINSIVLGNSAPVDADVSGPVASSTSSIIGGVSAADVFAMTSTVGDGVSAGVLADNRGPVQTVALRGDASNPALDIGQVTGNLMTDATGVTRNFDFAGVNNGGTVDAGAIEFVPSIVASGTTDDESLFGNILDDTLVGGAGNDSLFGQPGNDLLVGGELADLSNTAGGQVYRLYQATLDRAPDTTGFEGWVDILESGSNDLQGVVAGFVGSVEFQDIYGSLDNTDFVTLLYGNVLERAPDEDGLNGWLDALNTGTSRAQVVTGFSESAEFRADTSVPASAYADALESRAESGFYDDVYRLFQTTLDRAPNPAGLASWSEQLADGQSYTSVAAGFINSGEFRNTYGDLDDTDFIKQIYRNVLGREVDGPSLLGWQAVIRDSTREDVVRGIAQSPEFTFKAAPDVDAYMKEQGGNTLDGGAGNDTLYSGTTADTFVFDASEDGSDIVLQLDTWDTLQFEDFGYASAAEARAKMSAVGSDVRFADEGVTVTFAGANLATMQEVDYLFV